MRFIIIYLGLLFITNVFAFDNEDWQSYKLAQDIITPVKTNSTNYFFYTNEKVNYPKFLNRQRYYLPEVNVAGVHVHDGVMDITDSSHMFFTFDGAVFILDY